MNAISQPARAAVWQDSEMLECVSIVPEMPNTASFTFCAPSGALFDYKPGQFLTLEIPAESGTVHRTYTISSSPSRPRSITITAKAQADSIGTRWMLDNLKPGVRLKAFGPAGLFTNAASDADKYLFISAGSGITPMMSMTTCLWDEGTDLVAVLFDRPKLFGVRFPANPSKTTDTGALAVGRSIVFFALGCPNGDHGCFWNRLFNRVYK